MWAFLQLFAKIRRHPWACLARLLLGSGDVGRTRGYILCSPARSLLLFSLPAPKSLRKWFSPTPIECLLLLLENPLKTSYMGCVPLPFEICQAAGHGVWCWLSRNRCDGRVWSACPSWLKTREIHVMESVCLSKIHRS
ncbi:hypothetical protein BU25DRAFT_12972 [Macroventuria anomochaeta]|uniref:Uncharacterized protein n=1 Tax=Macroventuria anomochaeta TaxID=301207 RepID=A0ACB6SJV5_9PLEO|nr:uncharacterized protein BU25DRAFT_12972 [Macroventuria anomochaeta]KAF2633794.1 hypothetical protein BU25DRAFT_12972 [Macroventuria anomochaeta]